MTRNHDEFCKACERMFASLNRSYIGKMAILLGWSIDDLRQEFRLVCWEAQSETGRFDGSKGSIQEYFIGKLKNRIFRRDGFFSFRHLDEGDDLSENSHGHAVDGFMAEESVLELLIRIEDEQEAERRVQEEEEMLENLRIQSGIKKRIQQNWTQRLWEQDQAITLQELQGFEDHFACTGKGTGRSCQSRTRAVLKPRWVSTLPKPMSMWPFPAKRTFAASATMPKVTPK